jgi:hypothetical protein
MSLSYAMTNVFFKSISNQVIGVLKGNWSLQRRQRLPLRNSSFAVAPSPSPSLGEKAKGLRLWYNLNSFIYDQRGRKYFEGSNDSVFGDSCQRGESMNPKQKDRTTTNFKNLVLQRVFSIGILLCSKGGETLLNTKRRISFRGSFV